MKKSAPIQIVPQEDCDRLLERQSEARMAVRKNPLANLMNLRLRKTMQQRTRNMATVVHELRLPLPPKA